MIKPPESEFEGISLKNFVQDDIVNQDSDNLLCEAYTGFGKTYIGTKKIAKEASLNPYLNVHIIVPKEHLKDSWLEATKNLYKDYPLARIGIFIINSYTMNNKNNQCDLLIIDEVHRALNKNSEYFSTAIQNAIFKKSLFLTATLKPEYEAFLRQEMSKKGKSVDKYQVSLYWGFKNGLVPATQIYNVPLELTLREKANYLNAHNDHKKYSAYFAGLGYYAPYDLITPNAKRVREDIAKQLGQTEGAVFGMLMKWQKAISNRKQIVQNALSKYTATLDLLTQVKEKALVFCSTIDFAKRLEDANPDSISYHSKLKKKEKEEVLNQFYSNQKPHLISIDSLKEGFDIKSCRIGLRVSYTSNDLDAVQQLGRIIRFDEDNPDKAPIMINFFIDDFKLGADIIPSQEKLWLASSLKGQYTKTINLDELKELI